MQQLEPALLVSGSELGDEGDRTMNFDDETYASGDVSAALTTDGWDGGLRSYWQLGSGGGYGYGAALSDGEHVQIAVSSSDPDLTNLKLDGFKIAAALDSMSAFEIPDASLDSVILKLYQDNALVHTQDLGISTTSDFAQTKDISITYDGSFNKVRIYADVSGSPFVNLTSDVNLNFDDETYASGDVSAALTTEIGRAHV